VPAPTEGFAVEPEEAVAGGGNPIAAKALLGSPGLCGSSVPTFGAVPTGGVGETLNASRFSLQCWIRASRYPTILETSATECPESSSSSACLLFSFVALPTAFFTCCGIP